MICFYVLAVCLKKISSLPITRRNGRQGAACHVHRTSRAFKKKLKVFLKASINRVNANFMGCLGTARPRGRMLRQTAQVLRRTASWLLPSIPTLRPSTPNVTCNLRPTRFPPRCSAFLRVAVSIAPRTMPPVYRFPTV